MTDSILTQSVLFTELEKRPVVLAFDQEHGSSDGGAILLSAANRRFGDGLIESLSSCLHDARQQGKVDHQMAELMRQRIYGLACGYGDANDAARIGADPMQKLLAGRDPLKGLALASQPTLSRFENSVTPRSLLTMGITLAESVITRHGKRRNGHARLVTIDLDPTEAATYGAQQLSEETEHVYGDTSYAAKSWKHERRVIFKAEVVRANGKEPRDNPRFVITNMKQGAQWIYEQVYCQRGDVENRIKELKALDVDRTSCTNFWANQLRVLMAAAAYVLLQEIRLNAALTTLARAQVWTLRERLLKLGARIVASARRIVVHLPESFPWRNDFQKIASALGAAAG